MMVLALTASLAGEIEANGGAVGTLFPRRPPSQPPLPQGETGNEGEMGSLFSIFK